MTVKIIYCVYAYLTYIVIYFIIFFLLLLNTNYLPFLLRRMILLVCMCLFSLPIDNG